MMVRDQELRRSRQLRLAFIHCIGVGNAYCAIVSVSAGSYLLAAFSVFCMLLASRLSVPPLPKSTDKE